MERFIKGDVVVIEYPFSDLSGTKRRPALILARVSPSDFLLCAITSKTQPKTKTIPLTNAHLSSGNLKSESNIRPGYLFTADGKTFKYCLGHIKNEKVEEVVDKIVKILKQGS